MGVDVKLFINTKYTDYDVLDALREMGKEDVKINNNNGLYVTISFKSNNPNGPINRQLWFFPNHADEHLGLDGHLLSFRSDKEGIETLTELAMILGGVLQPADSREEYEVFEPQTRDLEWNVKRFANKMGGTEMHDTTYKQKVEMFIKYLQDELEGK